MDLLKNSDVSSDVVQALRQAVDVLATTGRSKPASSLSEIENSQRKFKPSSSKRQQLTAEEAAEIYKMRPKVESKGKRPKRGSMIRCKSIAPKFGVSAKTIRDIWRGRTWIEATRHLWTSEEKQRRAIHGEDQSDSDADDQVKQGETMSRMHGVAINNQFLQRTMSHETSSLAPNLQHHPIGSAPWVSGHASWPTNQLPFGHPTVSSQQLSCSSVMSPQLLQQKISMLEMALNALKSSPNLSQPTLSQTMLPSPFSAMGCPSFPSSNMVMNQLVRSGLNGGIYQSPQVFPPQI